jgi:hypothetical protein
MATSELRTGQKLKNSLFFSLLPGNLGVETGSTWTASATIKPGTIEAHHLKPIAGLEEGVAVTYDVGLTLLCSAPIVTG